jgi:cysteine synthase A
LRKWAVRRPSSGANLNSAEKVREAYPELKTIVTMLFCDEGERCIQDHSAEEVRVTSETYT